MNKNSDASKRQRQRQILQLVGQETVPNQEELRRRLARRGLRATQATLSRDLKELGLVKTPAGYTLPAAIGASEPTLPPLRHLLREFVLELRDAGNLLVLKTPPGSADIVGEALDVRKWSELVGTVAGDNTLLVITPSRKACRQLSARLRELMA